MAPNTKVTVRLTLAQIEALIGACCDADAMAEYDELAIRQDMPNRAKRERAVHAMLGAVRAKGLLEESNG